MNTVFMTDSDNYSGTAACTTCTTSTGTTAGTYYGYIPTFSITSVVEDETVTVQTYNFPASQTFAVRMGPFGTLGIGGTMVATVDSGERWILFGDLFHS